MEVSNDEVGDDGYDNGDDNGIDHIYYPYEADV